MKSGSFVKCRIVDKLSIFRYNKIEKDPKPDPFHNFIMRSADMWKNIDGRLIQFTDTSRIKFRTNISKAILDQLQDTAKQHDTHVNYLLETGLESLLTEGVIIFNKDTRPKDRVQYKTTYDMELLDSVREFAKQHRLYINDVIEYSTNFIDVPRSKDKSFKHRITMGPKG